MSERDVAVSITDTVPIVEGSSAREALHQAVDLARLAEELGYRRYWVAEHHGMRGVASCATSVIVGQVASSTTNLRVGAGGILLPNHPPLVIAEQFGTLEAFYPGRIDLGLGRALGGSKDTASLVRSSEDRTAVAFPDQIDELAGYFAPRGEGPVRAVPAPGNKPPIWLLGSSGYSAELAAARGLRYAFAHHLQPSSAVEAVECYRAAFTPTDECDRPTVLVSTSVIAADTDEHAEWLAGSTRLKVLRRSHGQPIRLPDPAAAAVYPYTAADREVINERKGGVLVGGPETVRAGLEQLVADTGARELMIATPVFDHDERKRSYELVASITNRLRAPASVPGAESRSGSQA